MAADVRVNTVSTQVAVIDHAALLSPELLQPIIMAVKASLADDARIATERARDVDVRRPHRPGEDG